MLLLLLVPPFAPKDVSSVPSALRRAKPERGVKSLYYCRSKSVQRAGFAGVEADNTRKPAVKPLTERADADSENRYDECLSCQ